MNLFELEGTLVDGRVLERRLPARSNWGCEYAVSPDAVLWIDHPQPEPTHEQFRRFQRQMFRVRTVTHPNLAAVIDAGFDEGYCWVLYLRAGGLPLAEARRFGPLTAAVAAEIAIAILRGLAVLHANQIVHGQVEPWNVVVDRERDGRRSVTVLDAQLSRARIALTPRIPAEMTVPSARIVATPEARRGTRCDDPRSDLHGVGAVLYGMLTGRPLFEAEHEWDYLTKLSRESPVDVATLRPDLGGRLASIVMRALACDPEKRFGSADEMAAALTDAMPDAVALSPS